MGAPKPTLGYPTRTDAVIALRKLNMTDVQIAEQLGIHPNTVSALIHSHKRKRQADELQRTVRVDIDAIEQLRPAAEARGIQPNELIRRLVATIADEGLTDAILDDHQEENTA